VEPILEHGLDPETVPVLLALREFASALRKKWHLELDRFLLERFEGLLPNLEDLLAKGRALVLLDGLDEVFHEDQRRWVSEQVWRLVTRFPETRFVLTSRPHGYQTAPLLGPVTRWQLEPFKDKDIRQFFWGWFSALARVGGEAGAKESPGMRADALTGKVLEQSRLKEMAKNPLLCTLIVLVNRSRSGQLPPRRVVFYEAAVRTLVELWEKDKRSPKQKGNPSLEIPEPEIMIRAMAEIAWRALHELSSREIPGDNLRKWFREYLEREPEWRGARGDRAVRDLLQLVGDRMGLLVDLGGDQYQFVHLSLHEWLISYFLLDRLTEAKRVEIMRFYLHHSDWEEALRLLVAGAPQAQSDLLVHEILQRPTSQWEYNLRRDLRFIFRCLKDHAPVGESVRRQVVEEAAEAITNKNLRDRTGFTEEAKSAFSERELLRDTLFLKMCEKRLGISSLAVEFLVDGWGRK
jgi:predicted NACHT family NTPase